MANRKMFSTR